MKIQIEVTAPRWLALGRRFRKLKATAMAGVAALIVGVPVAWASDVFADVPDSHPFHDAISAIKGAGITTGCQTGPPAQYCPDDPVRRGAMAAFMHRGFGRVAQSSDLVDSSIVFSGSVETDTAVAEVTIAVPGAGAGVIQFVKLDASATVMNGANPGLIHYYLARGSCTGAAGPTMSEDVLPGHWAGLSNTWVFQATPGAQTFVLCAYMAGEGQTADAASVSLNASTFPFGSTGTAVPSPGTAPSSPDARRDPRVVPSPS